MSWLKSAERAQVNDAVEIFSKLEGEIGELVRRDPGASPLQQENSELAALVVGGCSDGSGDEQNNRGHYGRARTDADRRKLGRQHLRQ